MLYTDDTDSVKTKYQSFGADVSEDRSQQRYQYTAENIFPSLGRL